MKAYPNIMILFSALIILLSLGLTEGQSFNLMMLMLGILQMVASLIGAGIITLPEKSTQTENDGMNKY